MSFWNEDRDNELRRLWYEKGLTVIDISRVLGCSDAYAYSRARTLGLPGRWAMRQDDRLRRMHQTAATIGMASAPVYEVARVPAAPAVFDGSKPIEVGNIRVTSPALDYMEDQARRRGITVEKLRDLLIMAIANDRLVSAVLDDEARAA